MKRVRYSSGRGPQAFEPEPLRFPGGRSQLVERKAEPGVQPHANHHGRQYAGPLARRSCQGRQPASQPASQPGRGSFRAVTFPGRPERSVGICGDSCTTRSARPADHDGRGPPLWRGSTGRGPGSRRCPGGIDGRRCPVRRPRAPEPELQRRLRASLVLGRVRGGWPRGGLAETTQSARVAPPWRGRLPHAQPGRQLLHGGRLPASAWRAAPRLGGGARAARLGARDRLDRAGHPALSRWPAAVTALATGPVGLPCRRHPVPGRCRRGHGRRHHRSSHSCRCQREPRHAFAPHGFRGVVGRRRSRVLPRAGPLLAGFAGGPGGQLPALVRRAPSAAEVAAGRARPSQALASR